MARSAATSSDVVESKTGSGLAGFRSSGVHVLEPYISPSVRCISRGVLHPGQPPGGTDVQPSGLTGVHNKHWQGYIPADNVGFRLLRKSGWSVGSGLGACEQGRRDPIEPVLPKGTRGLGFDRHAAQQQEQQAVHNCRKRPAGDDSEGQQAQERQSGAPNRVASLVQEELARESIIDKIARHRQVMRADQEQERGRAIEQYLRSAFNDPFDHLRSDNSNPLSRPHKLTQSNPLLDPIGDDD
ncbi:hypothetical protein Vretimale_16220 [Volvox reticuliferus]|uniref:Uncharacterized protein n=1 Tax=Volvox reticuliferus TaxID=1737510 RepID=A0A8J4FVZ9_9CHLO|nr:hypothetical protein Vretifemale_16925 [Volvox reticuliferus]GIM13039.1 hypothetical protein Vretimale_16220 [Volvox reticuliferus]